MAFVSIPISDQLFKTIIEYNFIDSPFKGNMDSLSLKAIGDKHYRNILAQMWDKIKSQIIRKKDEELYQLISHNINCPSFDDFLVYEGYDINIVPKTLKNCLVNQKGSEKVINLLTAFEKAIKVEEEEYSNLSRVCGYYNIFNLHASKQSKIQISNFKIEPEENKSWIKYKSRRLTTETKSIKIELIGTDKLLISLFEENYVLIFYAFIGALEAHEIIQAVYMYNNGLGYTIGSLALLHKVDGENQLIEPQREINNLSSIKTDATLNSNHKKTIQQFLFHRGYIIQPKLTHDKNAEEYLQFKFSDLAVSPGPYREEALYYQETDNYTGLFYIYFNERFPSIDIGEIRDNDFYSTVGKGILEIYKDSLSGCLKARMKTRKNTRDEIMIHEGYVMNNELKSPSYLILSLYEKSIQHRYINLILMKSGGDRILGSHNIMYSTVGELGVGAVVVERISFKNKPTPKFEDLKPEILHPFPSIQKDNTLDSVFSQKEKHQTIINYLSSNSNALLAPASKTNELKKFQSLKYSGVYKMYSPSTRKEGIRVSTLSISPSGFVEHKGISGSDETLAFGRAELNRTVLNITLKNSENKRTGFCCIKVTEIPPSVGSTSEKDLINGYYDPKTIYVGTFCGVTRRWGEYPLATKIILEFMAKNPEEQEFEPIIAEVNTREYRKIPKEVRVALSSNAPQNISFLGRRKDIYSLRDLDEFNQEKNTRPDPEEGKNDEMQILFERAVYYAIIKNSTTEAINFFRKAIDISDAPKELEATFFKEIKLFNPDIINTIKDGLGH